MILVAITSKLPWSGLFLERAAQASSLARSPARPERRARARVARRRERHIVADYRATPEIHPLCKSSGQFYVSLHASEIIIGFPSLTISSRQLVPAVRKMSAPGMRVLLDRRGVRSRGRSDV